MLLRRRGSSSRPLGSGREAIPLRTRRWFRRFVGRPWRDTAVRTGGAPTPIADKLEALEADVDRLSF